MPPITLSIDVDVPGGRAESLKAEAPAAIARALNRSIASAKTVMVRELASDLGLRQKDIRDAIRVWEANKDNLAAKLFASKQRLPLIIFNARGPEPSRGRGAGVTARLQGGAGRYPHAFIATVQGTLPNGVAAPTAHRGVFIRGRYLTRKSAGAWSKNLPIKQLFGPSIVHVFAKHRDVGIARAQEQLVKNLQHELQRALRASA